MARLARPGHRRNDGVPAVLPRARGADGLYEAVSGTRMHATYYRPGGVYRDLPDAMPQVQGLASGARQKDVDRLNEARSG